MLSVRSSWVLCGTIGLTAAFSAPMAGQEPTFGLEFRARAVESGLAGERAEFPVRCRLVTGGLPAGAEGAKGWSFGVVADNCSIVEGTPLSTVAAEVGRGGLVQGGFQNTELTVGEGNEGVVSAAILSIAQDVTLDPGDSPHDVLALSVAADTPQRGECVPCTLRYVSGLVGSGDPVPAVVTYKQQSFQPSLGRTVIDVCPVVCFPHEPTLAWPQFTVGDLEGASRPYPERPDDSYELCSASQGYSPLADNFLFLARPALREFELTATLESLAPSGTAGLDARADFGTFPNPVAPYIAIYVRRLALGGLELHSSYREEFGGNAALGGVDPAPIKLPVVLRIRQEGRVLTTEFSRDGGKTFVSHLVTEGTGTLYRTGTYRVGMAQAGEFARDVSPDRSSTAVFSSPSLSVQRTIMPPLIARVDPMIAPRNVVSKVRIIGSGLEGVTSVEIAGADAAIEDVSEKLVVVSVGPVQDAVRGDVVVRTTTGTQVVPGFVFAGNGFIRCDCNGDGELDISDAVAELAHQFLGGPPCLCSESGDCNGDGNQDISDAIAALTFLFLGGFVPPPPFPEPGVGTTPSLACGLPSVPEVLSISSDLIREGDIVTIKGSGFSPDPERNVVLFGQSEGEVLEASETQLLVKVGPILTDQRVSVAVLSDHLIDIITAFSCKLKACSPILTLPLDLRARVFEDPLQVSVVPSDVFPILTSRPTGDGGLEVQLDRAAVESGESAQILVDLLLPAVQQGSRGSLVGSFEHSFPVGKSSFEQSVVSLSDRLRTELSGGDGSFEFDVRSEPEAGIIRLTPSENLARFIDEFSFGFGGIGGYIPHPGRPPGGKCGPDDLDPIADERAFGWCRVAENVALCNGFPKFMYWIPDELVFQESDDIFPQPNPADRPNSDYSVMYNRDAYCHVRKHKLWNRCEVDKMVVNGDTQVPHFPRSAIVMKSSWRTADQMPGAAVLSKYFSYTQTGTNTTYYLVALHFTTKDIDDWFWLDLYIPVPGSTTFGGCGGTNSDVPASLAGTVWANYYLCTNVTNTQSLANHCGNFGFCPECPDTLDFACGSDTCLNCHESASVFTGSGSIDSDFLYSLSPITPSGGCP